MEPFKKAQLEEAVARCMNYYAERYLNGYVRPDFEPIELEECGLFIKPCSEGGWEDAGVLVYNKDENGNEDETISYALDTHFRYFSELLRCNIDIIEYIAGLIIIDWDL